MSNTNKPLTAEALFAKYSLREALEGGTVCSILLEEDAVRAMEHYAAQQTSWKDVRIAELEAVKKERDELKESAKGQLRVVQVAIQERDEAVKLLKAYGVISGSQFNGDAWEDDVKEYLSRLSSGK